MPVDMSCSLPRTTWDTFSTDEAVEEFFHRIGQVAQKIENVPASFTLARDPDDEPYLNLALAAATDYLVTRDQDMLDLMQDAGFRSRYPALIILTPVALLQVLAPPAQSAR